MRRNPHTLAPGYLFMLQTIFVEQMYVMLILKCICRRSCKGRQLFVFFSQHQDFFHFFLTSRYPASSGLARLSMPILRSPASRKTSFSALYLALKNLAGVLYCNKIKAFRKATVLTTGRASLPAALPPDGRRAPGWVRALQGG